MPPKGKKKKNPLNDFYFFMQDMKKVLRREGQDWETMEDLVALCHPRWKLLPEHDKARLVHIQYFVPLKKFLTLKYIGINNEQKIIRNKRDKIFKHVLIHKAEVCYK